jgi:hypothetical protein
MSREALLKECMHGRAILQDRRGVAGARCCLAWVERPVAEWQMTLGGFPSLWDNAAQGKANAVAMPFDRLRVLPIAFCPGLPPGCAQWLASTWLRSRTQAAC